MRSALGFWVEKKLYEFADEGITRKASDKITAGINKGTSSYSARWGYVQECWYNRIFRDAF